MRRMRKVCLLATVLLVLTGLSAGITTYEIDMHGETADVTITLELYPQNPDRDTRISSSWLLVKGMTVDTVRDSEGPVEFSVDNGRVSFETMVSAGEEKEVVRIRGTTDRVVDDEFRGLDLVTFQLSGVRDDKPGVPDEVTQARVTADRPILSESHSFGFDMSLGRSSANYSGEGPLNMHLAVSEQGEEYEYFTLFGAGDLSTADDLYWVPAAVTGFLPQVNTWPVVVYPDDTYDRRVDAWSSGQYRTGGIIFIRESTMEKDKGPAVLMHEVMHGFNDEALNWFAGDRAWFDEGTAKYVEWLVNANRSVPQAEIFGERVTWRCGPRERCSYEPRGTPAELWNFYQGGTNFPGLDTWTPLNSPDAETRTFGYALSELIVRDYTRRNGPASLRPAYADIRALNTELDQEIAGREANRRLKRIMGTDFRPCDDPDRDTFDRCLEDIHEMEGRVPALGDVGGDVKQVRITPIEPPKEPSSVFGNRSAGFPGDIGVDMAAAISRFFNGFWTFLQNLLGG